MRTKENLRKESCQSENVLTLVVKGIDMRETFHKTELQACLPAAKLALEDVNKREDILRGYHLNLAAKDDMVSRISRL